MKFIKWVVVNKAKSVGLFPVVTNSGLLCSWDKQLPCFGVEDPILFRFSHSRFLVRELRRSGYYVSAKPYCFYILKDTIKRCKDNFNNRRAVRKKWSK